MNPTIASNDHTKRLNEQPVGDEVYGADLGLRSDLGAPPDRAARASLAADPPQHPDRETGVQPLPLAPARPARHPREGRQARRAAEPLDLVSTA